MGNHPGFSHKSVDGGASGRWEASEGPEPPGEVTSIDKIAQISSQIVGFIKVALTVAS